ncbi:ATP-binding protein [Candidatus Woesearchaeota archaeon]|nr:ATP-binding protein [Candidatus Woesearchaeota archaeon]
MYFDTTPKTKRIDLFGRNFLLDTLISYSKDQSVRMIVLKGLRRTGKTSLLNVALAETKLTYLKIDVREAPYYDRREFMAYLIEKIKDKIGESLFHKIIKYISKIEVSYKDISTAFFLQIEQKFPTFFERLNEELEKKNEILMLAFDEVQLLHKIKFEYNFAAIYDDYKQIKLILTGSEMGLLDEFLGKRDAESPLYGRALIELEVPKFNEEETRSFLLKGFEQLKKNISHEEIKEVISNFDGIIGWATQYGWFRNQGKSHSQTISTVLEEGIKLTRKELDNFLANRNKSKYLKILNWISKGYNQWALIKHQFVNEENALSDRQLQLYLRELLDYGFIVKISENYFVTDPLLLRSVT